MSARREDKHRVRVRDLREGTVVVTGDAAHHLATVLRLGAGARVTAFDDGHEASAEIVDAANDRVTLTCSALTESVRGRELVLLYALSKGDKVDAVVRDAAELGATEVVIFSAARSVVKLDDARGDKKKDRWERIAEEAARQAGRADIPKIRGPMPLVEAIDSVHVARKYLLDPREKRRLAETLPGVLASREGVLFAVGPEGGFAPEEIAEASAHGCIPVSFGRSTLRTETVAAAVLGAIAVMDPASESDAR